MSTSAADNPPAAAIDAARHAKTATKIFPRPNAIEFMGLLIPA